MEEGKTERSRCSSPPFKKLEAVAHLGILLTMLQVADRPVSRMELTKWSFVLKHQSQSKGGDSFYDFLPYHYGPFSFALYQEMDKLVVQLASRKIAAPAVYTSGYESVSIDGFLNRLIITGIKHLINVRRNPIARRHEYLGCAWANTWNRSDTRDTNIVLADCLKPFDDVRLLLQ